MVEKIAKKARSLSAVRSPGMNGHHSALVIH